MRRGLFALAALAASLLVHTAPAAASKVCAYRVSTSSGLLCPYGRHQTLCLPHTTALGDCDIDLRCIGGAGFYCNLTLVSAGEPRAQCPFSSRRPAGIRCVPQTVLPSLRTPTPTQPGELPTDTPTATPEPATPTGTDTATVEDTATPTPEATLSATPTDAVATATATEVGAPTATVTATTNATATGTAAATETSTPVATATNTVSASATATATGAATATATTAPSATPTEGATAVATSTSTPGSTSTSTPGSTSTSTPGSTSTSTPAATSTGTAAATATNTAVATSTNTSVPTNTSTPGSTATNTATVAVATSTATPASTSTSTPAATNTSTPEATSTATTGPPPEHKCVLDTAPATDSQIQIHIAALPVPLTFGLSGALDIGGAGTASSCDIQSLNPVNIPSIGFVCISAASGCNAGVRHCGPGAGPALGVDVQSDGNAGACTSNAQCEGIAAAACAPDAVLSSGCTGYCTGPVAEACTNDTDCLGNDSCTGAGAPVACCTGAGTGTCGAANGACNGPNALTPAQRDLCQITCIDTAAHGPSEAGDIQCNLGSDLVVETGAPCNGTDVLIDVGTTCIPVSTQRATSLITDANFTPGSMLPNPPNVNDLAGNGIACDTFDSSTVTGLIGVGAVNFFGSALGDLAVGIKATCQ